MSTAQEREVLKEFIEVYREKICLWDMNSELYKNKDVKHAAWGLLTETLKKLDPTANVCTTKKKVENLRAAFFRELKKVRASQRTAVDESDVLVPNLWYYKLLSFLDNKEWGPCRSATDPLQTDQDHIKPPPQSDDESMESADNPEPVIIEVEPIKRRWSSRESQCSQNSRKSKRKPKIIHNVEVVEPVHYQDLTKYQEPKPKTTKTNSFGMYVGEQLEQISTFQRYVAEKLISEVIFHAKTGNLNYDSKIETPSKLNMHSSRCQSPEYNVLLRSPRKVEDNDPSEDEANPRTLLKALLTDGKQN